MTDQHSPAASSASEWLDNLVREQSKRFAGRETLWMDSSDEVKIEAIVQYLDAFYPPKA